MLTQRALKNIALGLSPSGKLLPTSEQTGVHKHVTTRKTLHVRKGYTYQSGKRIKSEHVPVSLLLTKWGKTT